MIRYATPGEHRLLHREPIQGVGGTTYGAPKYSSRSSTTSSREHGGLCIADEVQTGFGRTGDHFWGFQNWGVMPDIVTMAKGIGNGAPLGGGHHPAGDRQGADPAAIHFNTFGGNPISMTPGLATLEVIDEEDIQENARVVGGHLKAGLKELQTRHRLIGDVRGLGLMLGVELVRDRATKEPARERDARGAGAREGTRPAARQRRARTATCSASSRRCA